MIMLYTIAAKAVREWQIIVYERKQKEK